MMQTLQSDFVEAARARGIRERAVVYRHAFKNALIPVVTVVGLQFAALLGGAILTETTFSLNGVGQELVRAIIAGDYTMVQGIIVFYAILVIVVSLVVDIVNAFIDPRIKY
jgi:peptide/nickel transport system permease protein